MQKKGAFFTIIAIFLLTLFLLSYSIYSLNDKKTTQKRVSSLNNFVYSVEEDLPRQLKISSFRIIFLIQKRITETGSPIQNLNQTIEELFLNGSLSNQNQELMNGATFEDIKTNINQNAEKINTEVFLTNPEIKISQNSPWYINAELTVDIFIKDKNNLAQWNKTEIYTTQISIERFEDPLYVINTNGLITNKITKTNLTFNENNVENLTTHLENSYYISSTTAPSFLDRLQGNSEESENGIESLVYLPKLSQQGIPTKQKSCVDHIYFSSENPAKSQIQNMPSWFYLDNNNLEKYKVQDLTI